MTFNDDRGAGRGNVGRDDNAGHSKGSNAVRCDTQRQVVVRNRQVAAADKPCLLYTSPSPRDS